MTKLNGHLLYISNYSTALAHNGDRHVETHKTLIVCSERLVEKQCRRLNYHK